MEGSTKRRVEVEVRSVYGAPMIYPVSPDAKLFAGLARKKTLDHCDLAMIKTLGFEVVEVCAPKLVVAA